jgi:hypothetical protein
MTRPLGGRGLRQSYETKVIRVPMPLVETINDLVEKFYTSYNPENPDSELLTDKVTSSLGVCTVSKQDAITKAKVIISRKKSAKVSVLNLLQVLYQDKLLSIDG